VSDFYVGPDRRQEAEAASGRVKYPWWILPGLALQNNVVFVVGLVLSYQLENPTLFNVALGATIMHVAQSNGFFFGTTKGSQDKDAEAAADSAKKTEALAASAPAAAPTVTTVTNDPGPPPTTTVKTEPADTTAPTEPNGKP